jgi:hypothetical protein
VPGWLIDVMAKSPWVAVVALLCRLCHLTVKHLTQADPKNVAALGGVFGGRKRREDARALLESLRDQDNATPQVESPSKGEQNPPSG